MDSQHLSRRTLLQTLGLVGVASATAGAASPVRRYVPLTDGDHVNRLLSEFEEKYLKPGVTVGIEAAAFLDEDGKKRFSCKQYANVELDKDVATTITELRAGIEQRRGELSGQRLAQTLSGLPSYDQENILRLTSAVRGPYTLVAVVGSAADEHQDKSPSDIDILVLNGNTAEYISPAALFDNQIQNIFAQFRPVHGVEVVEIVKRYDPKKAQIMQEDIDRKAQGDPGHWYGAQIHAEFLLPRTVPFPAVPDLIQIDRSQDEDVGEIAKSRPIHLLAAAVGEKEAVAYNAAKLAQAMRTGKAALLYQGKENKLV